MGYTHYWSRKAKFSENEWLALKERVSKIINWANEHGIKMVSKADCDLSYLSIIDDNFIQLNGYEDEGHECFVIEREFNKRNPSDFCKTARKPYDIAVCMTLLVIYDLNPDLLEISSDGDWNSDWKDAREAYAEIFGKEIDNVLAKD